ncbi:MAG: hypothetical protein CMJ48_13135 [Planctomycetaceae bacterium]|nr:hypothetical protein [Planctomycetaceae bacterium]
MRVLTLVLASLVIAMSTQATDAAAKVRVALVTGVDHKAHDWKKSTPALRELLEEEERLEVRIFEDPEWLASDVLFDYDVVLLHFKNFDPFKREEQMRANLSSFAKNGGGVVVLHFACGAFEDWPEYRNLAGKVWDRKNTHDPRGPFTVNVVEKDHPITRGLTDFRTDDELYICLAGEKPVELLLAGRSRVTGKDHPLAFVLQYGKGRIFQTVLGHDAKALATPEIATLLQRACVWVGRR